MLATVFTLFLQLQQVFVFIFIAEIIWKVKLIVKFTNCFINNKEFLLLLNRIKPGSPKKKLCC